MKRFYFHAITFFALIIASCSSDDDNDISTSKNYLKVNGVEYDLNNIGQLEIWGSIPDVYLTTLYLHSGTVGKLDIGYHGDGAVIYFDIRSSTQEGLDTGEYTINYEDNFEGLPPKNTIVVAYFITDDDGSPFFTEERIPILNGKLRVSRSGNLYSITINCSGLNDEKIKGFYEGPLYIYYT
jgi:hypothetical protein